MKKNIISLFIILYSLFTPRIVFAEYVLPYPSYMPGNKLYRITRIIDKLKGYWYFGSIAQIRYHLGLADKYLVEAGTLMDYKQYLLGEDALTRSNQEFQKLPDLLKNARAQYPDISSLQKTLSEAAIAHEQMLKKLEVTVPDNVVWTPEKSNATKLPLRSDLEKARAIRQEPL